MARTLGSSCAAGIILGTLLFTYGCEKDTIVVPKRSVRSTTILMTSADSAAYIASLSGSSQIMTISSATTIPVSMGDSIDVYISSTECSGNPETVNVFGVFNSTIAAGACAALPGTFVTLGPAASSGDIFFTATHQQYGQGPPGNVESITTNQWRVGINDGFGDTDFDDVVLWVYGKCAPSGDSVLDSKEVREGFGKGRAHSKEDAAPGMGEKKERGGVVWRAPDGHYYTTEVDDPTATECHWAVASTIGAQPTIPGSIAVAYWHTHPHIKNEPVYGCSGGYAQTFGDGKFVPTADPDDPLMGGGSPSDWSDQQHPAAFPVYIPTKTNRVYRLDHQWYSNPSQNPNKWAMNPAGCAVRIP